MADFQEVYDIYFKDVYRYTLSLCRNEHLAEEITQETFFKALKNLDSFRGQCRLYVWLCQIAKNTYLTHIQKQTPQRPDPRPPSEEDPERAFLTKETTFELHRALHRLPEPYKEVFSLRVFGELSFRQIGVLFDKTESWARVTYHRAKLKIKEDFT